MDWKPKPKGYIHFIDNFPPRDASTQEFRRWFLSWFLFRGHSLSDESINSATNIWRKGKDIETLSTFDIKPQLLRIFAGTEDGNEMMILLSRLSDDMEYARKLVDVADPGSAHINPLVLLAFTTTSVYLAGRIAYGLIWDDNTEKNGIDELFGIIWLVLIGWKSVERWALRT